MANTDILSNLEHFGQNISVRGADLWYGDFHAIRDISVDIPARQVTAFHRSFGVRQIDLSQVLQPDERLGRRLPRIG